jgi:hypothetical protein
LKVHKRRGKKSFSKKEEIEEKKQKRGHWPVGLAGKANRSVTAKIAGGGNRSGVRVSHVKFRRTRK